MKSNIERLESVQIESDLDSIDGCLFTLIFWIAALGAIAWIVLAHG